MNDPLKQYLIIRKDLKMRRGKEIAQGAHASLKVLFDKGQIETRDKQDYMVIPLSVDDKAWFTEKFTKICLCCDSEEELLSLHQKAVALKLPCSLILDAGLTEFGGVPTYTVLGIGPVRASQAQPVTGHLKPY